MKLTCKCGQQYLSWNMQEYEAKLYCYRCGEKNHVEIPNHIPRLQWVEYVRGKLNEMYSL